MSKIGAVGAGRVMRERADVAGSPPILHEGRLPQARTEGYEDLDEAIEATVATVAYTVLYEPVLLAARRVAHEDVSARIYGRLPMSPPEGGAS